MDITVLLNQNVKYPSIYYVFCAEKETFFRISHFFSSETR